MNAKAQNKPKNKPKNKSGWIMLSITIILYVVIGFSDPSITQVALSKSLHSLKMIAPILLVVFFIMALINSFIKPKKIAKHLGKESGLKGEITAIGAGVLSHGPSYVWYPMLNELRDHGARDGLIVAFFYARAIKLPWLPVMISYFGLTFTILLTVYILIAALLQASIADRLVTQ